MNKEFWSVHIMKLNECLLRFLHHDTMTPWHTWHHEQRISPDTLYTVAGGPAQDPAQAGTVEVFEDSGRTVTIRTDALGHCQA